MLNEKKFEEVEEFDLKYCPYGDEHSKSYKQQLFDAGYILNMGDWKNVILSKKGKKTDLEDFVDNIYRPKFNNKFVGSMGDRNNCIRNLKWFLEEYPQYDFDIISSATDRYLSSKMRDGYSHTRRADYFIKKEDKAQGRISDLSIMCEEVANLPSNNTNNRMF